MTKILFRPIRTRLGYPNFANVMKEVEKTFDDKVKPELRSYFTRITKLWDHPVRFEARKKVTSRSISLYVGPTGTNAKFEARKKVTSRSISLYVGPTGTNAKLWIWITLGTKGPYKIPKRPKPPGFPLRFRTDYKPRTGRGYRYRGPGKAVGPWVSKHQVEHPGIKPREFEKHIKRFYTPKFHAHMRNALRRGARTL